MIRLNVRPLLPSSQLTLLCTHREDGMQRWWMKLGSETRILLTLPSQTFGESFLRKQAIHIGKQLICNQLSAKNTSGSEVRQQDT